MDYINETECSIYCHLIEQTPIFMMSKNLDNKLEKKSFLFPDAFMLGRRKIWKQMKLDFRQESLQNDFNDKLNQMFFRGVDSGIGDRVKLAELSYLFPEIINAKFNALD